MKFTEEMINEDEKRWHARDVVTELCYCGNYMCDRKAMTNNDIRFYAYIMRKAYYLLKEQEAEWLEVDDKHDAFDCSRCGAMVGRKCLYCPGCGARMKNGTRAMG